MEEGEREWEGLNGGGREREREGLNGGGGEREREGLNGGGREREGGVKWRREERQRGVEKIGRKEGRKERGRGVV